MNDNGSTALMVAATCGHAPIITALAEAGADLYVATSHNGSTALHLASSCGNVAAAEQLVRLDGPKAAPYGDDGPRRDAVAPRRACRVRADHPDPARRGR